MADSARPPDGRDQPAPVTGPVYGFTERGFNRVTSAVKLVEKELAPAATGRNSRYPIGGAVGQVAIVTTAITARAAKVAGKGKVTLQGLNSSGSYVDGKTLVDVWNPYAVSIAVGKWVTLVRGPGGWVVIGAECP